MGLIAGGAHAGWEPAGGLLAVEIAGCSAVVRGPACELPEDRRLRLWVSATAPELLDVRVDGRAASISSAVEQDGAAVAIEVPPGGRELSIRSAAGRARIALRPPRAAPELTEAERLRKGGNLDGAAERLAGPLGDPDPGRRGRAVAELARIHLARGRTDDAVAGLREAARLAADAGRLSDEFVARTALAFTLMYNGRRFVEARAELARAATSGAGLAWAPRHEGLPYYDGLLAYETGDLRAALDRFRTSRRRAERLHAGSYRWGALQAEANALGALGRSAEGEATLREAEPSTPAGDPCARAGLLTNLGWLSLSAASARELDGPVPVAERALEEAARLYAGGGCAKPWARANTLTNLALADVEAGHPDRARAHLADARGAAGASPPDARITVWWQDLEGRIALADGRPADALEAYERLAGLARGAHLPVALWSSALGRALSLEALGREGDAGEAYAEAESVLDRQRLLAPLGEGRETFLGRFDESGRQRVRFLLDRDAAAAAAAARRARARALTALRWAERIAGLEPAERARWDTALSTYRAERDALSSAARDDWRLPEDRLNAARDARRARELEVVAALENAFAVLGNAGPEGDRLAAPGDGELFLVYHPIPGGLAAFAITGAGIEARRLSAVSPDAAPAAIADRLLAPFRAAIDAAARIHVIAAGPLERVDFHALPWEGRPLFARVPVVYGVDRPRGAGHPGGSAPTPPGTLGAAVIVADPLDDLAGARQEARAVAGRLASAGYRTHVLAGSSATRSALREALESPGTAVFHYAGHGVFGGPDGWASALPLANGEALTVGDVLALARVPRDVVLSACDTATSGARAPVAGLGLAQAFVIAGADAVIAAARPVGDRVAARVMAAYYATAAGALDPAERLRRAALAALDGDPSADAASFRLLVP